MLILRTLVFGQAHGHQIVKHIQQTTDDVLQVEHGSLYPPLHRLERKGWITAKWELAGKDLSVSSSTTGSLLPGRNNS
jgi:DNA-binding PadR family transcriptional regulator